MFLTKTVVTEANLKSSCSCVSNKRMNSYFKEKVVWPYFVISFEK